MHSLIKHIHLSVNVCVMIYLHAVGNFLAVRQDLCQVLGPQDISQGGLRQQPGRSICIGDVCHSQNSVLHPVVHHAVHTDRHRVFGQHLDSRTGKEKKKTLQMGDRKDVGHDGE